MKFAPDLRLPLLMLGIAGLGVVAGVVRAARMDGLAVERLLPSLFTSLPVLLAPIGVLAAYTVWLQRRNRMVATWGGLAAAVGAAIYSFILLHPEMNRDANIGLGLYWIFGWFYPLGLVFSLGAALGDFVGRRGLSPSPAALEGAARQLLPLKPWLWPLLAPALVLLAASVQPVMRLYQNDVIQMDIGTVMRFIVPVAGQLAVSLSSALIVLLILRDRAAHDGELRPRLAALWGLCLGLSIALWLFSFGSSVLPSLSPEIHMLLYVALPIAGYAMGRWWGLKRES